MKLLMRRCGSGFELDIWGRLQREMFLLLRSRFCKQGFLSHSNIIEGGGGCSSKV